MRKTASCEWERAEYYFPDFGHRKFRERHFPTKTEHCPTNMNQPQSEMATSPKRNRRVHINPAVRSVEILSIYDYSPCEIAASWFDQEEMDKITQRCFKVLQRMECGGTKNGKKYCSRGLEGHSTLGAISKKKVRTAAVDAVLDEQARQWNENEEINIEAISDAYRKTTSSSQLWAQVVGNQDRQAADAYLYDDEEEYEQVFATARFASIQSFESGLKSPNQKRIRKVGSVAGMIQTSARAA